jgi:hypothetical protein
MVKKLTKKKAVKNVPSLASLERLVRGGFNRVDQRFEQIDRRFAGVDLEMRNLKRAMDDRFSIVEDRIDKLANHVDGFMKLHETLDIEFKVIKEHM